MAECNGEYKYTTRNAVRRRVWKGKIDSANNYCFCAKASVKIPTGGSFLLNAKPSHFQACIWRQACESRPPLLEQLEHGWIWDTVNTILTPVMWPAGLPSAPDYISIMINCSCENCGSARCSCVSSGLPCRPTVFCRCDDSNECLNSRRSLMLLCKCQIQIVIRKMSYETETTRTGYAH